MGSKVLAATVVGVLVGAGAVLLLRPTPLTTKVVSVTSDAPNPPRLSVNPLTISQSRDQVEWQAIPATKFEYIEFEQKIFANAAFFNGRWRVKCTDSICDSGAPLATLPSQPVEGFKYWYGLADTATSNPIWGTDGRIIIIKP